MLPLMLGLGAASALMQANQANQRRKQQQRFNQGQAEMTRYSPWTGMQGQLDQSFVPDALSAGLAGGIQGVGAAQGLMSGYNKLQQPAAPQAPALQDMPMGINQDPNLYGSGWAGMTA